ncbi:hypothetical protein L1987_05339 [Smallanthus sonchifolius]|uniref:Uncharacterized protein n=1 Tax=Smallanthus sonchifolius TaxID=185202 RepID=A0ACB9JVI8_9ASTR|nr:hypothetical protein L1987_05339 [Smallanthus sonchifolius]
MFTLFLFFAILSGDFNLATAQNNFWAKKCGVAEYDYDGSFRLELDDVLYNFTATNNGYGYYCSPFKNGSVVALCRGYLEPESCRRCCIPDLSAKDCDNCLVAAMETFIHFTRVPVARVYLTNCNLQFEYYEFFNSTWFPDRTFSRNSKSTNVRVIVGPISAIVVLAVIFLLFCLWYQKRRGRGTSLPEPEPQFDEGSNPEREDNDTRDVNSFDLSTIQFSISMRLILPFYKTVIFMMNFDCNSGYMAPEYALHNLFSVKSDVYSFGVMLLEIIAGRPNNLQSFFAEPENLLSKAWRLWQINRAEELSDRRLDQEFPVDQVLRWLNIALLALQEDPQDRPTMSIVVSMLQGQWPESLPSPSEPLHALRFWSTCQETTTIGECSTTNITNFSTTSTLLVEGNVIQYFIR